METTDLVERAVAEVNGRFPEWTPTPAMLGYARAVARAALEAAGVPVLQAQLAKADLSRTAYARALEKMRQMLIAVHDGLEDEGDRVYLGSTNHADSIHEAWHLADALNWDEILAHTQPETPLASTNLALQARAEKLEGALRPFADYADEWEGRGLADNFLAGIMLGELRNARAALAEDYCGIVEVNEEDFKAEGERG